MRPRREALENRGDFGAGARLRDVNDVTGLAQEVIRTPQGFGGLASLSREAALAQVANGHKGRVAGGAQAQQQGRRRRGYR